MLPARALIALWVLGWTAQAAPRLAIELTPKGPLSLEVVAGDKTASASLGAALAQSLGCALGAMGEASDGGDWAFRATCTGSFERREQTLEGTLRFATFRAPLRALHITSLAVDVAMPNTPYRNSGFSRNWERAVEDGTVHYRRVATPGQLPATVHLALGYRQRELELMLAPAGVATLAALAWMALLHLLGPRIKGNRLRNLRWGLAAIFLAWATAWAVISRVFGGDFEAWALYTTWHGWSAFSGKVSATLLYCLPPLAVTALAARWPPPAADTPWRAILIPALAWIVPAYWTIAAFGALTIGEPLLALLRLVIAAGSAILFGYPDFRRGTIAAELRPMAALFSGLTAGMVLAHLLHLTRVALAAPATMAVAVAVVAGMEWWVAARAGRAVPAESEAPSLEASPAS